jgi:hypothetical protein
MSARVFAHPAITSVALSTICIVNSLQVIAHQGGRTPRHRRYLLLELVPGGAWQRRAS